MAKMRMTLVVDYDTGANAEEDLNNYGTVDPYAMAIIDEANLRLHTATMLAAVSDGEVVKAIVEPVIE